MVGITLAIDNQDAGASNENRPGDTQTCHRLLAENCSDMIAVLDLDGRYVYVSPASVPLFGQTEADLLGHRAVEYAHPDDAGKLPALIAEIRRTPMVHTLTFRRRRHDGQYCWVESKLQGILGPDGAVSEIILTARDISERRQAEEELHLAALAFEALHGMIITSPDGTILRVNEGFTHITGYPADEVVGRNPSLLRSGRHDRKFFRSLWDSVIRTGSWKGEMWNRRKNGEIYPQWLSITAIKAASGETTHYVGSFADITQHKADTDKIEHMAFYDPLTRLPNRRLLEDRLHQALAISLRSKREGALLFIDLDNFKTVNDTLGHDKGDELLQQVAKRLTASVRESDTVARLGGDEFVVMLEELSENRSEAATQTRFVGKKILDALDAPYKLAAHDVECSASIGVTLFGDHRQNMHDILKQADLAMYRVKTGGRNGIRFFDPEMQSAISERASLESDLRKAVRDNQLLLHYQPQVDTDGRLTGAEALLRWHHPTRGMVFPDIFIPVAEATGMIVALGRWVLKTACEQLATWAERPETSHLSLAVNVSAGEFRQADFVQRALETVRGSGADPAKLKLELTESMLLDDIDDAIVKMQTMRQHGLSFSLDDFGTGYSSLAYLKSLPLSQLKIDRSFVTDVHTDPNAAAIAKTIVFLARSLGLTVIAEGVETEVQRHFLAENGCGDYQGYLFSRPLPLDEFERFAANPSNRQDLVT